MDIGTGAILAAASAPKFDPNLFVETTATGCPPCWPIARRRCSTASAQMAIPPGSTFKTLTAVALLESAAVGPQERFTCQGYLHHPDRQRCEIFVRQGIGHGQVALADALAVSCNVYFLHFAGLMGPRPLVDWAERFGFGRPTGVDLPSEAAGTLPSPENIEKLKAHAWRTVDTRSFAIGQGSLTATPLQVLCMMAAVANGGRLVTPHLAKRGRVRGQGQGRDRGQTTALQDASLECRCTHPTTLPAIREDCFAWWPIRRGPPTPRCTSSRSPSRARRARRKRAAIGPVTPGSPATCRPKGRSWRLSSSWSTPARPPRPLARWPSGWCCEWSSWGCCRERLGIPHTSPHDAGNQRMKTPSCNRFFCLLASKMGESRGFRRKIGPHIVVSRTLPLPFLWDMETISYAA